VDEGAIDFVLLAWREDGRWGVEALPNRAADSLDALVHTARQQPSDGGAIALVSVADDFFIAVRVQGDEERVLLSDVTAAQDWDLAREVLDSAGVPIPEGDDLDAVQPGGDLQLFADLGVDAIEIDLLCSDLELFPDEALGRIAARAGFGEQFDLAVESLPD
jgi:putative tRNA adenosine deaminase-associated protein